jgi:heterodisulfide reductase subunit C
MGLKDELLKSASIWICASCETCTTRCPNDIDVAKIIDSLRMTAKKSGVKLGENRAPIFHSSVLQSIKTTGRLYELGMIGLFMLRTSGDLIGNIKSGALMEDMKVGMKLFRHGKLKLFPSFTKRKKAITKSFKKIKRGEVA